MSEIDKKKALKAERLLELEQMELVRQEEVKQDGLFYLLLLGVQFLPLFDSFVPLASRLYFYIVATTTVYVGGKLTPASSDDTEIVSRKSALLAPLGASASILIFYSLLKLGLDPTKVYAVIVTLFGAIAISDVGVPLLRNVFDNDNSDAFATTQIKLPPFLAEAFDEESLPLDGVLALFLGVVAVGIYWWPVDMTQKFIVSNLIAWAIGMVSLGSISLGSTQTGVILLLGLFCYDIFWVFGTDVMMTVATKVEAPIKFIYARSSATPSISTSYPFSVLGLGDVIIPGLFVRFLQQVDEGLQPEKFSYFDAGAIAYAIGLAVCFVVNQISGAGQPALLYLDPACVGSAFLVALANNQVPDLWNFALPEPEETRT